MNPEKVRDASGYHVVHWSGHGHHNLLELLGADGKPDRLTGAALVDLFAEADEQLVGTRRRRRIGWDRTRRLYPHHQIAFEQRLLAGRGPRDLPGHPGERSREAILQGLRLPDQKGTLISPRVQRRLISGPRTF